MVCNVKRSTYDGHLTWKVEEENVLQGVRRKAPDLLPCNNFMVGNKLRWYVTTPERKLDLPSLSVIEAVEDRFATAVDYRPYSLLKKSSRHDDDVAHDLQMMAKNKVVQITDHTFSWEKLMSVNSFFQVFKSACETCRIEEGAKIRLFKQFLTGLAKAAVKA